MLNDLVQAVSGILAFNILVYKGREFFFNFKKESYFHYNMNLFKTGNFMQNITIHAVIQCLYYFVSEFIKASILYISSGSNHII